MPEWLSPGARKIWEEVAVFFGDLGLAEADSGYIALYCDLTQKYRKASAEVERDGCSITTARGMIRAHPSLGALPKLVAQMRGLATALGFEPKGREENAIERGDPIGALLGGKR
ncbi:MAG: phage terminase small subunit P27 family [Patescibacteria group bacterium]